VADRAPTLPLGDLDPEVLERLGAEMTKRRPNLGAHFYGLRGQKQYGLDIVVREAVGTNSVYQVRRYVVLTPDDITAAVAEYADPQPLGPGGEKPPRRLTAGRCVLFTSAELSQSWLRAYMRLRAAWPGQPAGFGAGEEYAEVLLRVGLRGADGADHLRGPAVHDGRALRFRGDQHYPPGDRGPDQRGIPAVPVPRPARSTAPTSGARQSAHLQPPPGRGPIQGLPSRWR
jgi:hypothetical protein